MFNFPIWFFFVIFQNKMDGERHDAQSGNTIEQELLRLLRLIISTIAAVLESIRNLQSDLICIFDYILESHII